VTGVSASPLDPLSAASCSVDRTLRLWALGRGVAAAALPCASAPLCLAHAGGALLSGHHDGGLRIWDARSGRAEHEVSGLHARELVSVAAAPAGGGGERVVSIADLGFCLECSCCVLK
jgi:hypothetical protein